jgi:hypothetical protein
LLASCAFWPSGAPPWSLGCATLPIWPAVWCSGSGDWRPAFGADMVMWLVGVFGRSAVVLEV